MRGILIDVSGVRGGIFRYRKPRIHGLPQLRGAKVDCGFVPYTMEVRVPAGIRVS